MDGLTKDQELAIERTIAEISRCPGGWWSTSPEMAQSWAAAEEK